MTTSMDCLTRPLLSQQGDETEAPYFRSTRVAGPFRCYRPRAPCLQGVYQIGEDQARSWIEVGSPSGTSTPSALASYVDQRGVGI